VDVRLELQTVSEQVEVSETTQSIATRRRDDPERIPNAAAVDSLPTAQEKFAKFFGDPRP